MIRLHEQALEGVTPGAAMDILFTRVAQAQARLYASTPHGRRSRHALAVHTRNERV